MQEEEDAKREIDEEKWEHERSNPRAVNDASLRQIDYERVRRTIVLN